MTIESKLLYKPYFPYQMNIIKHEKLTQEDVELYFFYRINGVKQAYFERYFYYLPISVTMAEAFDRVNQEYFELFGEYKYSCIRSFRAALINHFD